MALRNQPYLPLYVQDFLTDEKLAECSASATGVYIRIMCLMHKSEEYGKILLKQKYKQSDNQILNFALQLVKNFPYDSAIIQKGIAELVDEGVLIIDGDFLIQKRMVKDAEISHKRALAGKTGGEKTQEKNHEFASGFAKANDEPKKKANAEYEIEYINTDNTSNIEETDSVGGNPEMLSPKMLTLFKTEFPKYPLDTEKDFTACRKISHHIAKLNGWTRESVTNGRMQDVMSEWGRMIKFIKSDKWYSGKSIEFICKDWQNFTQSYNAKSQVATTLTPHEQEIQRKREEFQNRDK